MNAKWHTVGKHTIDLTQVEMISEGVCCEGRAEFFLNFKSGHSEQIVIEGPDADVTYEYLLQAIRRQGA